MRRAAGLVFVAAASAACSLLVSLDDLGAHDGGTDGAPDAASDAPDDGGSEAAVAFCKRANHTFCDDFDEAPLGTLWSSQHVASGTLVLDDAAASPPNALFADVPNAQAAGTAYLEKDFTGSASRITCAFDARMDYLATVPILSFSLALSSTDPNRVAYNVTLLHTSAKTSYSEWTGSPDGGGSSTSSDLPVLPVGASKFTHVVVDMNIAGGSIGITFDGASVLATPLSAPPSNGQTLLLGVIEYVATQATMHFDDVACDITP